jgi:uncharacterized protein
VPAGFRAMSIGAEAGLLRVAIFGGLITIVFGVAFFGALAALLAKLGLRPMTGFERRVTHIFVALSILGVACIAYGRFIEPDWLSVTHLELTTDKLPAGARIRIVHLSDLHVGDPTRVLEALPSRVNELAPDLIVFTGDSLMFPEALPLFQRTMSAMKARYGRFAVRGNHDYWHVDRDALFDGGAAHELTGVPTSTAGIVLCGAGHAYGQDLGRCLSASPSGFRVAVFHTPDLVEALAPLSPDLYLAGHTHGGQVRLPIYGALVTLSDFDKKYEMGRYTVGATTLFVSRGIGVEPAPAPRVRFLCRPEIAVIDVVGTGR